MRSAIFALTSASLLFVFVTAVGCGGAVAGIDDAGTSDQADAGAGFDSGHRGTFDDGGDTVQIDDGGIVAIGCPAAPPKDGAGCATADLTCEYGGVGPHLRCSTVYACIAVGNEAATWSARMPPPACVGSQADNAASCPASFGALANGSACPANTGWECVYPEGLCECSPCGLADGGGSANLWRCQDWPVAQPPCPSPRPRIGTPCTVENQGCYYGSICSSVGFDQPAMACRKGFWHDDPLPQGPPCPFPFCGH